MYLTQSGLLATVLLIRSIFTVFLAITRGARWGIRYWSWQSNIVWMHLAAVGRKSSVSFASELHYVIVECSLLVSSLKSSSEFFPFFLNTELRCMWRCKIAFLDTQSSFQPTTSPVRSISCNLVMSPAAPPISYAVSQFFGLIRGMVDVSTLCW